MDFNNHILIIDVANIRDRDPATMKTRTHEGRNIPLSSLQYLDSALAALEKQVPSGTVLKIADFSLQYNFSDDERTEFKRRTKLDPIDSQYIYQLPYQSKPSERKGGLFRRKSTDDPDFVEADDIILSLALELDAYVISGDTYSDEKFDHHMKSIRERLFVHQFDAASDSWIFAKSLEYYARNRNTRDDWNRIKSLTTIAHEVGSHRRFEAQSDIDIRRFAFETLIEEFWVDRRARVTIDQGRRLTSNPLKNLISSISLRPQQAAISSRSIDFSTHTPATAGNRRALVPVETAQLPSKTIGNAQIPRRMPTFFAKAGPAISAYENQRIAIIGILVRDGSNVYIEWVLSDKRIKIQAERSSDFPRTGELVRITGTLVQDDSDICLKVELSDTVTILDLEDIVKKRVESVRSNQPKRQLSHWFLPAMRWGGRRARLNKPFLEPGFVPRPIPTSFPKHVAAPKSLGIQEDTVQSRVPGSEDWTSDPFLNEFDEIQLLEPVMTSVNSFGRIEFSEPISRNDSSTQSARRWQLLILVGIGIVAAIGIYFFTRQGSELIIPLQSKRCVFRIDYEVIDDSCFSIEFKGFVRLLGI
jgi:hypothetical protein